MWSTNPLLSVGVIIPLCHSLVASGMIVNQMSCCRQGMKRNGSLMCVHSSLTALSLLFFLAVTVQRHHSASEALFSSLSLVIATTAEIISVMRGEGLERQQWYSRERNEDGG